VEVFFLTFFTSLQDTTTLDFPFSFSQDQLREQLEFNLTQDTFPKEYLPPFFLSKEANLMFGWLVFVLAPSTSWGFFTKVGSGAWELEVHAHFGLLWW
jgi:hypothetical protein